MSMFFEMSKDLVFIGVFFFFKQKTAYEMRISDWSSDVCSSDLLAQEGGTGPLTPTGAVPGHRRFADAVPPGLSFHYAVAGIARPEQWEEIGRASCRERVCQYV